VRNFFAIILPVLLLAACNFPLSTPEAVTATSNSQNCYFNWASQPLPDLSAKVQSAINAAGLADVSENAEAYGENCIDSQTNTPVSFGTLETDFHITVKVVNLTDKKNLGNLLEKILVVLDTFPAGKIPGPQPGSINVSFQAGSDELNLMFSVPAGKSARLEGLHGAELLEKLQKK
jgi:hypothetical protein